jgi:sialic acid synthase SpsE
VAKRDIRAGERCNQDNLYFAWPPVGISVEHWDLVSGNEAACDLQANQAVRWSDIKFADSRADRFRGQKV